MKLTRLSLVAVAFALPVLASAQTAVANVPNLLLYVISFINGILVPVIFAVAFLMFLIGVYRYFIAGGGNPEKVQEGQKFVMWSLLGFFVMFSIWGLVNLLVNTLGFGGANMPGIPQFNPSGSATPSYSAAPIGSPSPTSAAAAPQDGTVGPGGSCVGNPNACGTGYICSSMQACVSIPANGTMGNGQSCLGNVNACTNGLTCATQSGDICLPGSDSGAATVSCPGGGSADTLADC